MRLENKRPIRVAHIIGKLTAGGVEAVVYNYYKNIDHSRFQFDFFYDKDSPFTPPKELVELGANFYPIPSYKNIFSYIGSLVRLFKKNKYLIVHSNMNTLSPFSLYAAKLSGVPVRIIHNHSTAGKGEFKKNCLKYALKPFAKCFATKYCACGNYAGKWLFGKKTFDSGKITVFKNAIDLTKFKFNEDIRKKVRHELNVEDKLVVGHIGRFCKQKNHEFLIKVFEKIHDIKQNSVLVLVGVGELEKEIKNLVHQKKLDDCVKFLGKRNDCNELYQVMDVFVLPSNYEGLGIVGIEAQSVGIPSLFSENIPLETKISPNVKFLSLEDSSEKWAKEAIELSKLGIARDNSYAADHGYDIKKEAFKLVEFYDKCLDEFK